VESVDNGRLQTFVISSDPLPKRLNDFIIPVPLRAVTVAILSNHGYPDYTRYLYYMYVMYLNKSMHVYLYMYMYVYVHIHIHISIYNKYVFIYTYS
jgi:hypothetical protein